MPYKTCVAGDAGDEVSSTYEGRHVSVLESNLIHVNQAADNLVNKGQPVLCTGVASLVGVSFHSALAATDWVTIDTEGVWYLSVTAAAAMIVGQHVWITNAGLLVDGNAAGNKSFGWVLQPHTGQGAALVIAVKVHGECPIVPTP